MLESFFILLAMLGCLAVTILFSLYIYGYFVNHNKTPPDFTPLAYVLVPVKGKGTNLEQNLTSICTQEYPSYQVLFILDSKQDEAYPLVTSIVQQHSHAQVLISHHKEGRSGKLSALLTGIKNAEKAVVYVFADADINPHNEWLRYLVAYLSDETIGATSGYRWYFAHDWKSSLISAWNMAPISGMYFLFLNSTWGGSTAIKKSVFEELHIEEKWSKGFSDDLILTEAVKKQSDYRIKFVPQCLVDSPSEESMKKFLHWSTQQFTWVRWYAPLNWFVSLAGFLMLGFVIFFGAALIFLGQIVLGLIMISPLFFEMIFGLVGIVTLRNLMRYPKKNCKYTYRYGLLTPIVFLLQTYNALSSGLKQHIVWGGRIYRKKDVIK